MFISVIIPVHNGGQTFQQCLAALKRTHYEAWECIVVDDASTDGTAELALDYKKVRVLTLPRQVGPAMARNMGAQAARGDVLLFLDADVTVQPGTIGYMAATLQANPTVAACFGTYEPESVYSNFLSQYRTLQHHYVHQHGRIEAATFRGTCGAIRRDVFMQVGGFNGRAFTRPSIEDIELGYRLRAAGHAIRLEKLLQVGHVKQWNLRDMLVTDIRDRVVPWTQLIMQRQMLPNDLHVRTSQRLSSAAAIIGSSAFLFTFVSGWWWFVVLLALLELIHQNIDFYGFLQRRKGLPFMLVAIPWHWFYCLYIGLGFAATVFLYLVGRLDRWGVEQLRPLSSLHLPTRSRSSTDQLRF